jgi:hypothetical protein
MEKNQYKPFLQNVTLNLLIVICLFFQREAFSQENTLPVYAKSYWIDLGPGWSARDFAFTASLNLELEKRLLLTLSYDQASYPTDVAEMASAFTLGLIPVAYKPGFDTHSLSLKIGKVIKGNMGLMTFSAGISSVKATEYSSTVALGSTSAVGASFDIKLIPVVKFIGVALNPFVNINNIHSYGGLTINLALGQLNYREN